MANVRKVIHPSGLERWQATISTSDGKRKSKNFDRKGDAQTWIRENDKAPANGSSSMTFRDLAHDHNRWFNGLVRSGERGQITLDGYDSHLYTHVIPNKRIADKKLSELSAPDLQSLLDDMVANGASIDRARRVKKSISAWCKHGVRKGYLKINLAEALTVAKRRRKKVDLKLPPKTALSALLKAAGEGDHPERDTALVHLLMFGGFRISELLGMADEALELRRNAPNTAAVTERLCTKYAVLGPVKSDEGAREVPIGSGTASTARAWRVRRGTAPSFVQGAERRPGRLFPGSEGVWSYQEWRRQCWFPLMIRAGLGRLEKDKAGSLRPVVDFGPHTLRHVYASIQIENGVTPKRLQKLLGHATLAMTMDLYGHLWTDPAGDQIMADAAERLIPRLA